MNIFKGTVANAKGCITNQDEVAGEGTGKETGMY